MNRQYIPQPVLDAAHARAAARSARDWPTADRLKAEIESAGWRVIDRGTDFRLEPAHPPDLEDGDGIRYGRSDAVPSRLREPSTCPASIILVATDQPDDLERSIAALRLTAPAGTQAVVVADAPDAAQSSRLPASGPDEGSRLEVEVVRTSARLGWATAWNIGIRRARGDVVILLDASVEPVGDIVTPLVAALGNDGVAVAGASGLRTADLLRFEGVAAGNAASIDGSVLAFRRADAADAANAAADPGPLDEAFRLPRYLDTWWSLVLRDRGEGTPPRRAVVVGDLPVVRHERRSGTPVPPAERDRLGKRNFYRLLERFRGRADLAVP